MRRAFALILGCVIGSMALVSCHKDNPDVVDDYDYTIVYGGVVPESTTSISEEEMSYLNGIFQTYETKLKALPGYTPLEGKFHFRLEGKKLSEAITLIGNACLSAEAELGQYSAVIGDSVSSLLTTSFSMQVGYIASNDSSGYIYVRNFNPASY